MLKGGYLTKRPFSGGFGRAKRRYVALYADSMSWFASDADPAPLGELPLTAYSVVNLAEGSGGAVWLSVRSGDATLLLSGAPTELREWFAAVDSASRARTFFVVGFCCCSEDTPPRVPMANGALTLACSCTGSSSAPDRAVRTHSRRFKHSGSRSRGGERGGSGSECAGSSHFDQPICATHTPARNAAKRAEAAATAAAPAATAAATSGSCCRRRADVTLPWARRDHCPTFLLLHLRRRRRRRRRRHTHSSAVVDRAVRSRECGAWWASRAAARRTAGERRTHVARGREGGWSS